jgi:hypothetical protein
MSEIKDINLNNFELKSTDVDDPVALKVSWNAFNASSTNFKNQAIDVSDDKIRIKQPKKMDQLTALFLAPGIATFLYGLSDFFSGDWLFGFFMILLGSVLGGIGFNLLKKTSNDFTLDLTKGTYHVGNHLDEVSQRDRFVNGYIKDIHALQILKERIASSSKDGKSKSHNNYEVNIVLKDGERINIMEHQHIEYVNSYAVKLSGILGVSIWKAQY